MNGKLLFCILIVVFATGCKKYLDVKSSNSLAVPGTPQDFQALLDNYEKLNFKEISSAQISSDDYFINNTDFTAVAENLRRIYTWSENNLFPQATNDWSLLYDKVYVSNIILDNIDKVDQNEYGKRAVENIKGQACFVRAYSFFQLATTFAMTYSKPSENSEPGIPLRLTSDINEKLSRGTIRETFERIIRDAEAAVALLDTNAMHPLRASKRAALGLLARVYLYMGDYQKSGEYATRCLQIKNTLLSYNTPAIPNLDARFPFSPTSLQYNNPEIIYVSRIDPPAIILNTRAKMDTNLMKEYKAGDNRKKVLFAAGTGGNLSYFNFKGSYEGTSNLFNGIAADELYLIKSECQARTGDFTAGITTLNELLRSRWDKNVPYVDIKAASQEEALGIILLERRKSLVFRGLRWMDIKRLNREGAGIVLKRVINGMDYSLPANDPRYAIAIPESIINISGIPQNRR